MVENTTVKGGNRGQSFEVLRKHAGLQNRKPWFDSTRTGMENKIEIEPSPLTFRPKTIEWAELEDIIMDALDTAHHGNEPLILNEGDDAALDMVAVANVAINALKDSGIVIEGE